MKAGLPLRRQIFLPQIIRDRRMHLHQYAIGQSPLCFLPQLFGDLFHDRGGRHHVPRTRAFRTTRIATFLQRGSGLVTRHLDQSEHRHFHDRRAYAIFFDRRPQCCEHEFAIFFALHINKINDDHAADIAQANLSRHFLRRGEIDAQRQIVPTVSAPKCSGIDIDRGQRFGRINHDVRAARHLHAAFEQRSDRVLNAVLHEQIIRRDIGHFHLWLFGNQIDKPFIRGAIVRDNLFGRRRHVIARGAQHNIRLPIKTRRRGCDLRPPPDTFPGAPQEREVMR